MTRKQNKRYETNGFQNIEKQATQSRDPWEDVNKGGGPCDWNSLFPRGHFQAVTQEGGTHRKIAVLLSGRERERERDQSSEISWWLGFIEPSAREKGTVQRKKFKESFLPFFGWVLTCT